MNYFRDVSELHDVLIAVYKNAVCEERHATLSRFLEEMGVHAGSRLPFCFDRALPGGRGIGRTGLD